MTIVHLPRVDSTQSTIFDLAAQGASDRTVVVADYQAAGRGRRGRAWDAAPGTSLLTPIRARWLVLADTIGRRVSVDGITGVAVDLDVDGALVLQDGERRHRIVAGEVGVL